MLSRIHEWLIDNPIIHPCDIAFLQETVACRKQIAEDSVKEAAEEDTCLGSGYWNSTACMRLIHALIDHDHIKRIFLNRMNLTDG